MQSHGVFFTVMSICISYAHHLRNIHTVLSITMAKSSAEGVAKQPKEHVGSKQAKIGPSDYVSNDQTIKAIEELRKFAERRVENKDGKADLFADEDQEDLSKLDLFLIFKFKKLYSHRAGFKPKSIALPKSIYDQGSLRTCLIIRDNFVTEEILNAIEQAKIPTLAKVIPFNDIKTVYNPYEKREELVNDYDFFVVDDALFSSLPTYLGKTFYMSDKFPRIVRATQVDNKKEFSLSGLESSITKALGSASFLPPFSQEVTLKVASLSLSFSQEDILANINAVLKYFDSADLITVGLKLHESPVLPLFYAARIYDDADVLENAPQSLSAEKSSPDDVLAKALLEITDEQTVSTLLGKRRVKRSPKDAGRVVKP